MAISSASDSGAATPVVAGDGTGGVIVAWSDHRDVDQHFYVTRRLASGAVPAGWTAGGVALAGDTGWDPDIVSDGEGGAYVAWKYFGDVAIQHVTAAGVVGGDWYAPNGATLPGHTALATARVSAPDMTEHAEALHPHVLADPGVGAVGVYPNNGRFFNTTWVGKLYRPTVTPPASTSYGMVDASSYDQQDPAACDDGANGVLVAYVGNPGVQVRRYAEDGTSPAGWPMTAIAGDAATALGICPDGANGAFVASADPDPAGIGEFSGLRLQHVRGDGTLAPGWPASGITVTSTRNEAGLVRGDDPWGGHQVAIVADGSGGAILAWTDLRADAGDVYALRVKGDGGLAPGWSAGGSIVAAGAGTQNLPQLAADGVGGAYLAWVDTRDDAAGDLFATHLSATGTTLGGWPLGGQSVASGAGGIVTPRIVADGAGGAYVTWVDTRGTQPQVRLSRLSSGGVAGIEPSSAGAGAGLLDAPVRPDPWTEAATVAFALPRAAHTRIELLDVTGRRVAGRELGTLDPGEHFVALAPEHPLPAGVYLVRVWAGDSVWSARTVHLR